MSPLDAPHADGPAPDAVAPSDGRAPSALAPDAPASATASRGHDDVPDGEGPTPGAHPSDIDAASEAPRAGEDTFPVVGIGASAGGLAAFQAFFSALPAQPGMAFVIVQHLSPHHESALAELIQTRTQMTVTQVADHPDVEPNRVYVIPPARHLEIEDGHLQLVASRRDRGRPSAVDHFFRTLAEDMGERAVCIVLSGTGSDGSLGLKAIKERAGLTMAQAPADAEHDGMPRSAIGTDLVDVVGTPAELAAALIAIRDATGQLDVPAADTDDLPETDHQALQAIFAHLRQRTAHDFTHYKRSTILRRLGRRLQVTGQPSLAAYAQYLRAHADEVQALLRDFLISVTQFFRDEDAFDVLARDGIPALFEGKGPADQVRVWVAGCATGEEAYSVAMLLCEHRDTLARPPDLQVFATDIDEAALARAREGHYARVAAADVSPARLRRFFDVEADGVRVKAELRQIVLFALHNLLADPPFSRLDLVACRNVLIYLNREIQERVFATFHYALRPDGQLFLGSAEGPDALSKGFSSVHKAARLYRRIDAPGAHLPRLPMRTGPRADEARSRPADPPREGLVERYRDWTLDQYAPPRLLVDEHYDVTHVFGDAGRYLRDREGPVTQNVVDKVLRAFRIDLRAALFRAFSAGETTDTRFQRVTVGGEDRVARLHVGPVGGAAAGDALAEVVFLELDPATVAALRDEVVVRGDADGEPDDPTAARLEDELRQLRTRLQRTVEEGETSNEELKASNEELQSINEELQSASEELETSKEELQSTNEELTTVNHELKGTVDELIRANSDLQNLIASTQVGTLFLDRDLRLKRYTPRAADLFHVIPTDLGRPFSHLTHRLVHDGIAETAQQVLDTLVPVEAEVEGADGGWYVVRTMPYRTTDDRIEGVVLTFVDVTELRAAREEARRRAGQQKSVADLGQAALEGMPLADLFQKACECAADCLDAEFAKVLRHRPDTHDLVLAAGVGWADGLVGAGTVPDDEHSQAGFTLIASSPVVVPDLASETRFTGPPLLLTHDVESGISVPIRGPGAVPYGVFGVHSTRPHTFSEADIEFVVALSNVLGDAVRQAHNRDVIARQLDEIETIYGMAPVGLAYLDTDLRYRRVNQQLADLNGLSIGDHLGARARDLLPELAETVEPLLRQAMETGRAIEDVEVRGATPASPDEPRVWLCSYVPDLGPNGAARGVSIVVRDVTARARTSERLAQTLQQLSFVLDGAHVGVWTLDPHRDRLHLDARAQRILGVPEQCRLADGLAFVHPDERDSVRRRVERALASADATFEADVQVLAEGGQARWVSVRGRVDPAPTGRRVLTGIVFDISGAKWAQQELHALTVDLEQRVDVRSRQVRQLAMELSRVEQAERQRIALVLHDDLQQYLYAVQVKGALARRALDAAAPDLARQHVAEAEALVGQSIETCRTLTVDLSPPVLSEEGLERSLDWLGHRIGETHGLAVEVTGATDVHVEADLRILLVRIVRELLFNVVKHAGTDRATVRLATDGETVRIEVVDAGGGFRPDDDDAAAEGFGLSSVRERLILVGGRLEIDSAPGTGSRVVVTSPVRLGGAAPPAPRPPADA